MKRYLYLTLITCVFVTIGEPSRPPRSLNAQDVAKPSAKPSVDNHKPEKKDASDAESDESDSANKESSDAKKSDSPADDKSESKTPNVVKVDGIFEATQSWELVHDHDQIETFEIERILPHGTIVSKGQTVVWLDSKPIDKQLAAAEIQLKLAELAAADDQFAYDQFIETQELDREAAERARQHARQSYDNYVKVDREQTLENAEFSLKNSQYYLENAMEELTQLTQMYEEDDLTEESEEIVMKRAKRAVESAEFSLKAAKIREARTVEQTIPQRDTTEEADLAKAELAYAKAMRDLKSAKEQRDLKRKQAATELAEKIKDFETLREQRKAIVMKAPGEGILLHGELTRGALPAKESILEAGSKLSQDQVVATIVNPDKLRVRLELSESQLANVVKGAECVIKPASMPDESLPGVVTHVDTVPFAAKKFDAKVKIKGKVDDSIVPTMSCSVEFTK